MNIINVLISLLVFGMLVFVHELGHFVIAKKNGVKVYEFAIGMGPALYKREYGKTLYSLNLIPIGGYVRMSPFEDKGEELCDPQEDFLNKSPLQKIAVAVAGPVMNILFAIILFTIVSGFSFGTMTNRVGELVEGYPAQKAGLKEGDTIVSVGSVEVSSWEEITSELSKEQYAQGVTLGVVSKGEEVKKELHVVPVEEQGRYVVGFRPYVVRDVANALPNGLKMTWRISTEMLSFVQKLFTGRTATDDLSGPVGIIQVVSASAERGVIDVLFIAGVISLNLAILNLLPIPALDGSRILFSIVELLRRGKKIPQEWENRINFAGFALLMGLMLLLTYKDVLRIFRGA